MDILTKPDANNLNPQRGSKPGVRGGANESLLLKIPPACATRYAELHQSPLDWSSKCAIHPANQTGSLTRVPYRAQPHFVLKPALVLRVRLQDFWKKQASVAWATRRMQRKNRAK